MVAMAPKKKNWTAKQVKDLRSELDLTQHEAAALLRISQPLWAAWESGARKPSPSHRLLLELLEAGELPPSDS